MGRSVPVPGARIWWIVGVLVILAAAPLVITSHYIRQLLIISMLYAVIATSWDLSLGYGGVFNFAHVAFFAIGAYATGILTKSLGFAPFVAILCGGAAAVIVSIISCLPVLRVKGIYICLVTFAFSQLCLHVVRSLGKITGGMHGLVMIPPVRIGGYSFAANNGIAYYYLALVLLILATLFVRRLVNSYFGLSIIALRDYEEYAVSRGVPFTRQRLLTFVTSAVFTGMTGGVYALYLGMVSLDLFGFGYITTLLGMVIVGGVATTYGPILGAFILGFGTEFMTDLGPWRNIITAVLVVLVLWFYPEGIYGALSRLGGLVRRKRKA
jgi:branched-chain amino acid transport system permease protein